MRKLVVLEADEQELEERGLDFENELYWLKESGIMAKQIIHIPEALQELDLIEAVWIMRQVEKSLLVLKEKNVITDVTEEIITSITMQLFENHETVDQDLEHRVGEILSELI